VSIKKEWKIFFNAILFLYFVAENFLLKHLGINFPGRNRNPVNSGMFEWKFKKDFYSPVGFFVCSIKIIVN